MDQELLQLVEVEVLPLSVLMEVQVQEVPVVLEQQQVLMQVL